MDGLLKLIATINFLLVMANPIIYIVLGGILGFRKYNNVLISSIKSIYT